MCFQQSLCQTESTRVHPPPPWNTHILPTTRDGLLHLSQTSSSGPIKMPQLKQLTCRIESGSKNTPLIDYDPTYGDGWVKSFIAVPATSLGRTFSVHLTSHGYIAPGLAFFVFIDSVSQCNRNRVGLIQTTDPKEKWRMEVDFRVRQKEEMLDHGRWIGREWKFEELYTGE